MPKKMVGRPPKYKCKEEIEQLIEGYFKSCEGEVFRGEDGEVVFDKFGHPVVMGARPPTGTGLALALGFNSRQALLNYQAKKEFVDTITRAKARVEQYTEERLFDRDGANGARFSLTNNFSGWGERLPSALDQEEQKARIAQIKAQTEKLKGSDSSAELERLDEVLKEIKGVV